MKAYNDLLVKHRKVFLSVLRLCTSHKSGRLGFSRCIARVTGTSSRVCFLTTVRMKVRLTRLLSVILCLPFCCSHATIAGFLFRNCSVSMLINGNREGRELTNVGEMVCLRIAKNERNKFRFSNRLGNTQGRTAVIGNFESTNVRQHQRLRPLKSNLSCVMARSP